MDETGELLLQRLIRAAAGPDSGLAVEAELLASTWDSTVPAVLIAAALGGRDVAAALGGRDIAAAVGGHGEAAELLARARAAATTTRERQLVALAAAHLDGDHDRFDALVRDHLADHPDDVLAAWIAARHIT